MHILFSLGINQSELNIWLEYLFHGWYEKYYSVYPISKWNCNSAAASFSSSTFVDAVTGNISYMKVAVFMSSQNFW